MEYKVYSLTDIQVERINSELMRFNDQLMQMYMLAEGKKFKFLDYTKAYVLAAETNDYDRLVSLIRESVERRKRDIGSIF